MARRRVNPNIVKLNRAPALGLVEYVPLTVKSGNLKAFCATCETVMHRRVPRSALAATMPDLDVHFAERSLRLCGSPSPTLNCDFERQTVA